MAIEGYFKSGFDILPAPYVQAYLYFPRLDLADTVDFLIDTGADYTSIHPGDVNRLGIDYRRLRRTSLSSFSGIGGSMDYYEESGLLIFHESTGETRNHTLNIRISASKNDPEIQGLPSLLGRDFLNLCSSSIDKSKNLVRVEFIEDSVGSGKIMPAT